VPNEVDAEVLDEPLTRGIALTPSAGGDGI
jgi:hypothetical protein